MDGQCAFRVAEDRRRSPTRLATPVTAAGGKYHDEDAKGRPRSPECDCHPSRRQEGHVTWAATQGRSGIAMDASPDQVWTPSLPVRHRLLVHGPHRGHTRRRRHRPHDIRRIPADEHHHHVESGQRLAYSTTADPTAAESATSPDRGRAAAAPCSAWSPAASSPATTGPTNTKRWPRAADVPAHPARIRHPLPRTGRNDDHGVRPMPERLANRLDDPARGVGVTCRCKQDDRVDVTPDGLPPIDGVVYFTNADTIGVRTDDALYGSSAATSADHVLAPPVRRPRPPERSRPLDGLAGPNARRPMMRLHHPSQEPTMRDVV